MKKTTITTLLYILLAMALCLTLAACNTTPATHDPADTNPEATQPQDTNPQETDPSDTGNQETDPVDTDPVDTDTADTDPVDPPKTVDVTYEKTVQGEYLVTGLTDPNATDIVIPAEIDGNKISAIAEYAFKDNTTLKTVTIEDGVEIQQSAFYGCTNLETVVLPSTIECLDGGVFENCVALTNLTIPEAVNEIVEYAFTGCEKLLEDVDGVKYIGQWAIEISDPDQQEISVREGTVGIACGFHNDTQALVITIPEGVKYINARALLRNSAAIILPSSIEVIGTRAFFKATGLSAEINLPNVVTIGSNAFRNATSIQKVILGAKVQPVPVDEQGFGPFFGCTSLSEVVLMSGNKAEEAYFLGTDGPEITFIYPDVAE